MRIIFNKLLGLGMLLSSFMSYAEVYRWVDSEGAVHFSDEPVTGAKPVQEQPITTFPEKTWQDETSGSNIAQTTANSYQSIAIRTPKPQSTIWDVNGRVAVVLECKPSLRKQHKVMLLLDNQPIGSPTKNRLVALAGVLRGAHTLRAVIVNEQHKTIQSSKVVVFYLQKPRIAKPEVPGALYKQPE